MRPWARPQGKMGPAARLSPTRSPISRLGAAFSRTPGSRRRLGRCRRSTRQVLGRKRLRREAVPYRALDGERERVEADAHDDSGEPVFPRPQYRRQQAHVLVVIDWAAPSDRRHGIRRPRHRYEAKPPVCLAGGSLHGTFVVGTRGRRREPWKPGPERLERREELVVSLIRRRHRLRPAIRDHLRGIVRRGRRRARGVQFALSHGRSESPRRESQSRGHRPVRGKTAASAL